MATAPGATMPEEYLADVYEVPVQVSLWQDAWRRVRRNRFALLGFSVIVLFIMVGARISLEVGIGSAAAVSAIGITLGLLAGFYRSWVDTVISTMINIWYGIPDLLVALILVFVLSDALHLISRGVVVIMVAIAATRWMDMARLVRGQTLS